MKAVTCAASAFHAVPRHVVDVTCPWFNGHCGEWKTFGGVAASSETALHAVCGRPTMHASVLPAEVLEKLAPQPGQTVVDATAGAGGHSRLIAERLGPGGRLIALDQDAEMLALARARLEGVDCKVSLFHANFDALREVLDELEVQAVDGVLADLGICSDQLDQPERGFSFQQPGPLDMRMDASAGEPAAALLKRLNEKDLADLIYQYGEERFSRRIARKIVETRKQQPIETTEDLAELVRRCVPRQHGRQTIDPATRTFQALRIAVNDELGALERLLKQLPGCLNPGGKAAIISFHSLEDRLVKRAFQNREQWQVLTKKPLQAGEEEVRDNPRARSAKLRVAQKLAE
jgi:16S rRNA (cytosine1402-N4)-methyltransferase